MIVTIEVQRSPVILIPENEPPITVEVQQPAIVLSPYGPQGAQGPAGPASAFYVHTQSTPATLWTIPHNLGFRPTVSVTTNGGLEVLADVQHLSDNTLTVSLLTAMAGIARLT